MCDTERAIELREQYEDIQPGYHMNKALWDHRSIVYFICARLSALQGCRIYEPGEAIARAGFKQLT